MQFQSLPGFREFYPQACTQRNHIFAHWRRVAQAFNFQEYDAPVLEPLELYIEKSGEEVVGQLFHFQDRGGRAVALRPEMTPSLARLIATRAHSLKRPIKWFNIGEHYRYEKPQKGRLRAFYQLNVDIFGVAGPAADVEMIALLVQTLAVFGLDSTDFKVRLSDRKLWCLMLAAEGLDSAASAAVLGIIDKLERMDRGLVLEKLAEVLGDGASGFFARVEQALTIRDFDALSTYILNLPLQDDLAIQARQRLNDWQALLRGLQSSGAGDFIQVDLGIVRGLAYYTGFVFEAFEASGEGRALAGGGRYDGLVKKLGGPQIPAVGFAMGDVTLTDLLESKHLLPTYVERVDFMLITDGSESRDAALSDAALLRSRGYCVDYSLKDQAFGKQFKYANQQGARFALIYGSDEMYKGVVKIRDFSTGVEQECPRQTLAEQIPELLVSGIAAAQS